MYLLEAQDFIFISMDKMDECLNSNSCNMLNAEKS